MSSVLLRTKSIHIQLLATLQNGRTALKAATTHYYCCECIDQVEGGLFRPASHDSRKGAKDTPDSTEAVTLNASELHTSTSIPDSDET